MEDSNGTPKMPGLGSSSSSACCNADFVRPDRNLTRKYVLNPLSLSDDFGDVSTADRDTLYGVSNSVRSIFTACCHTLDVEQ